MEKNVLDKLRKTEIEMLKCIDRICKKNNINYFIIYGTLLGGIRHKGFIPWDDDIDIAMPRADYEKFIKIADSELDDNYKLDYFTTNKKYYLPFAKVRNINTVFAEESLVNYNGEKGVFIDIFPFDNMKSNNRGKLYFLKSRIVNVLYSMLIYKSLKLKQPKKIQIISCFFTNTFINKLIKLISKGPKNGGYLNFYSPFGERYCLIYDKKDVFPLKEIPFDSFIVKAPSNSEKILTQLYGNNFMELPPVEERTTHNPLYIKFEDGKVYNFQDK